jgi:hypothetical protein
MQVQLTLIPGSFSRFKNQAFRPLPRPFRGNPRLSFASVPAAE